MLEEIEMLCASKKIRRHSSLDEGADSKMGVEAEKEFDEEKLCNICYFTDKDTVIVPCGHQTCFKCIQVHTQNR